MTKVFRYLAIIIVPISVMVSCSDEDPKLPKPIIDFQTDPEIVEVGVEVTFENLSLNASSYEWDFGDGQTSTEISPTIIYEETGEYTVQLKAFTEDNQSDSLSQDIIVGERILTAISINSIPFVNSDGDDWDDATGQPDSTRLPDFILFMGPQDDPSIGLATPLLTDLAPFELPLGFELNPNADPFVLTDETWELTFIDFDGEDINNAQESDFELMERITFNPVQIPTGIVDENGEGFVQVSIGTYSVDFYFRIE